MTDARWTRLADLVPDALALDDAARGSFLDAACRAADGTLDADLRTAAERLVAASDQAERTGALASPVAGLAGRADAVPERVGPWRITGVLGEGGMGVVYRADRADGRFERAVALKVVRHAGRALARRFDRERRALALLEHAHIARLYDAGVDRAMPYLAMELIEGAPLTAEADRLGLDVDGRVRLMLQVCEAVAYAHGRLVLHRDLKPSNVLVADDAGRPRAVVLDFGIARLLGDDDDDGLTQSGGRLYTPAYAAPEQLAGGEVTTATDVYGLGALLYQTLAGARPYDLGTATAAETERRKALSPRPPSAAAPANRARALRGDLDTICLKALDPDPARRYTSADALADDLQRHLGGLPVEARPATVGYRAGRFVRRHRTGVGAAVLVALALIVGLGAALSQRDRARVAAAEATEHAERAQAVSGFLEQILRAPNAMWYVEGEAKGPETPIRAVLDEAAARVDRDFADRPDLLADLHHILGDTYGGLGLHQEGRSHHDRVLALRESLYTPPDPRLAEALFYSASFRGMTEVAAQGRMLERALAMQRERPEGNNFPFIVDALGSLYVMLGRDADADALSAEGIAFAQAHFVPGSDGARYRDRMVLALLTWRVEALLNLGRLGDAERQLRAADSVMAQMPPTSDAYSAWRSVACQRGHLLRLRRQFAQAEPPLLTCAGVPPPRGLPSPFRRSPESATNRRHWDDVAAVQLVALYDAWDRPNEAARYRANAARFRAHRDSVRTLYREP